LQSRIGRGCAAAWNCSRTSASSSRACLPDQTSDHVSPRPQDDRARCSLPPGWPARSILR
jgi:hypothetical protein